MYKKCKYGGIITCNDRKDCKTCILNPNTKGMPMRGKVVSFPSKEDKREEKKDNN